MLYHRYLTAFKFINLKFKNSVIIIKRYVFILRNELDSLYRFCLYFKLGIVYRNEVLDYLNILASLNGCGIKSVKDSSVTVFLLIKSNNSGRF